MVSIKLLPLNIYREASKAFLNAYGVWNKNTFEFLIIQTYNACCKQSFAKLLLQKDFIGQLEFMATT